MPKLTRTATALLATAALAVSLIGLLSGGGVSGSGGTTLSFEIGGDDCIEVGVGDEIDVDLVISAISDLQAFEATIEHDFGVINIVSQNAKVFLSGAIDGSDPLPDNDGRHLLGAVLLGSASSAGPTTLATLTFKAVGTGISTIGIPQTDFDGNGTTDFGLILTKYPGQIIGDVNGDDFFDGPVGGARIAVNESCSAPTEEPTAAPTPAPATPTPTPTPPPTSSETPAVSPTPTPIPTVTATPTGGAGGTPTGSPAPTGTVGAGTSTPVQSDAVWGDNNCSGSADPVDSLLTLRYDAALSADTGECPDMGQVVDVALASPHLWGDVDCGGSITPVDSLKLLRYDAGLSVVQPAGCPEPGAPVVIS